MDWLWMRIVALVGLAKEGLDALTAPLLFLGPTATVALLALGTVLAAKLFSRYRTRRYHRLKAEFEYWFDVRQKALASSEDRDKAEMLARDIDKSKLNRLYYDFFLEGFLNNLLTSYLPVLCMAAYVNEAFRPQVMAARFGREELFMLPWFGGEVPMAGLPFFVFTVIGWYVAIAATPALYRRLRRARTGSVAAPSAGGQGSEA
ncbi:hypothetical protein [Desulfohalovibrio reitneri]|uniref:hypothetical protein n=1 Tax=Desulfohalovibrio reitneri TaxID=1307759 RepID=UPI0004A76D70|nr:hypothetical protein [Desulfohalovibrio reitneri]